MVPRLLSVFKPLEEIYRATTNKYKVIIGKEVSSQFGFLLIGCILLLLAFTSVGFTDELQIVPEIEFQQLASATQRLISEPVARVHNGAWMP